MTYEEIIQLPVKRIEKQAYYYNNGERIDVALEDYVKARIYFNAKLIGSVMKGMELELKVPVPNTEIYLNVTAKSGENKASKLYGPYYMKEEPTYNADSGTYTYLLYDKILNLMVDYKPIQITYPTTIYGFFKTMVTQLGYSTNITSLPNGDKTIEGDIYEGINYTYRDVLEDIGQATATLFGVTGNEIIKYTLGQTEIIINDDVLMNQNIAMGEHFGPVNTIVLSRGGGADNIYYPETLPKNPVEFKISDNQLMNGNNRDTFMAEIYQKLKGIEYDIYDCQLTGFGGFEPLQKIKIKTLDGNTEKVYNSYVFNNEIIIDSDYEESIYTELPSESVTDYKVADTTDKRIDNVSLIVDKQQKEIKALAESTVIVSNKIVGYEKVKLANIAKDGLHELKLNGDLHATIVNDNLYASPIVKSGIFKSGVIKTGSGKYFKSGLLISENTFILDFVLSIYKDNELIKSYPLPIKDLYVLDNVRDEFIWLNGKMSILHKIGISTLGEKYILLNPYYEELGDLEIQNEKGDIQISFDYMPNARIEATYLLDNEYTNRFATQVELQSEINVRSEQVEILSKAQTDTDELLQSSIKTTAGEIELLSKNKVGDDEIIASINTAIKDKQGIVTLTGNQVIIDSDNFKLDKDGNLKCNDATMNNSTANNLNVNGGTIKLTQIEETATAFEVNQTVDGKEYKHTFGGGGENVYLDGNKKINLSIVGNYESGKLELYDSSNDKRIDINGRLGSITTNDGNTTINNGSMYFNNSSGSRTITLSGTSGTIRCSGNLTVQGTKSRIVKTNNYGERLLNAYETPVPYFGDIGSNKTDNSGYCKIEIEDIFKETIELDNYKIFIQELGDGHLYVKKYENYFEVLGTPNLEFDWELKAIQKGYSKVRLEKAEPILENNQNNDIIEKESETNAEN